MPEKGNPPLSIKTCLDRNGRLVIPAAMREQMGLKPGEPVFLDVEDGVLKIESFSTRIRRIQAEVAKYIPAGVLLSEELIAERREEVRREQEEFERDLEAARIRRAG